MNIKSKQQLRASGTRFVDPFLYSILTFVSLNSSSQRCSQQQEGSTCSCKYTREAWSVHTVEQAASTNICMLSTPSSAEVFTYKLSQYMTVLWLQDLDIDDIQLPKLQAIEHAEHAQIALSQCRKKKKKKRRTYQRTVLRTMKNVIYS